MKQQVLQSIGFSPLNRTQVQAREVVQEKIVISARPTNGNSQIALSIPRNILNKLNWEISQRVNVLFNPNNQTIAVIRAQPTDKNSFLISCQGTTVDEAIRLQRGGVVRFAWRDIMGDKPTFEGQINTSMSRDRSTLIVDFPQALAA